MKEKESQLDKLYGLLEGSKDVGIDLTEEQLNQAAQKEKEFIRNEIFPLLKKNIEPVLKKVKSEITLVVGYKPDSGITLRISREQDLSDLADAPMFVSDDIPEYKKRNKQKRIKDKDEREPIQVIKVSMPDGSVIFNSKNGTDTFCKVLERIGLNRVHDLENIKSGINIVSNVKDPNRRQHQIGNFYIFTNLSTRDKKQVLDRIAKELQIDMKVEIVKR